MVANKMTEYTCSTLAFPCLEAGLWIKTTKKFYILSLSLFFKPLIVLKYAIVDKKIKSYFSKKYYFKKSLQTIRLNNSIFEDNFAIKNLKILINALHIKIECIIY